MLQIARFLGWTCVRVLSVWEDSEYARIQNLVADTEAVLTPAYN